MTKKPSIRYRDWLGREPAAPEPVGAVPEQQLPDAEHAEHAEELRETAETAIEAMVEPAVETSVEPAIEPAIEPAVEPTVEPAIEPAIEPAVEATVEPAMEPAIEPAIEPTAEAAAAPAPREHLVFRVGRELFALPLDAVDEAIDIESVQHLPEMSAAMLGVLSLRGSLVPLYAPAATLGVAAAHGSAALIFVTPRGRVALAVDDVDDVMDIAPDALQRAPMDFGDGVLVGVARRGADLIGVLDAGALMGACRAEPVLETA